MPKYPIHREFGFMLNDVARLLRTYADHKAAQFGITRQVNSRSPSSRKFRT